MRSVRARVLRVSCLLSVVCGLLVHSSVPAAAQTSGELVYGVTASNRLLAFNSATPGTIFGPVPITNLQPNEQIVGLDVRPATNELYALGISGQLYVLDQRNGNGTRIGAPLTPALEGTAFGFDFNPTVDRIRIVSNTGQNLRVNPETAAVIVDGRLAYGLADVNAGRTPRIVAAGYTNPDNNATTGTTLFDIDATLGIGVTQNPPNDGTLNTFANIGGATTEQVGFDISLQDILIATQAPGATSSTLISFGTGQRRVVGTIGGGEIVHSIAVSLGSPIFAPANLVYATTTGNQLINFTADAPGTILQRGVITNLAAGENIVGIDFRPFTNQLYALGSTGQLYTIDVRTAAAVRVGTPMTLNGSEFGFDFNPAVDRIRIVSNTGQNLRVNPDTAAVIVDGNLAFAPGDTNASRTPRVTGAAYTNPDNNPATGTQLFVFDSGLDIGALQDPPNNGTLSTVVPFGVDAGEIVGFDISVSRLLVAYVPAIGAQTTLVDFVNGARRVLGTVGTGDTIRGLAISLGR